MIYIKNIITALLVLVAIQANAQTILTKKEALQIALENNYGVKIANNNVAIAKNNSSIYNSRHLPTLSTNAGPTTIIVTKKLKDKMALLPM